MRNISTAVRDHYDDDRYIWTIIIRRFCENYDDIVWKLTANSIYMATFAYKSHSPAPKANHSSDILKAWVVLKCKLFAWIILQ
jgi:hypothetical protein